MPKIFHESSYIFHFISRINMYEEHTFAFPAKTGPARFVHSWSLKCYNDFGEYSGGGTSGSTYDAVNYFTLPFSEVVKVSTQEHGLRFGKLHIEKISETSTSLKIKYWVTCEQAGKLGWYEELEWRGDLLCRTESVPEQTDSKPTGLLCEGSIFPQVMMNPKPAFSAIFQDLIGQASTAQVEVYLETAEASVPVWDSGWLARNPRDGERCRNIIYAGSTLLMNQKIYKWRIRFRDLEDAVGDWSDYAYFRTSLEHPPDPTGTAPTELLCEGEAHPTEVSDSTPEFSAINNLGMATTHYQIVVSKNLAEQGYYPKEPFVWNSGWLGDSTPSGQRCPDKEYGVSVEGQKILAFDGTIYYWAIRFKNETYDRVIISEWSKAAIFRMAVEEPPPTFEVVQTFSSNTYATPKHIFEHEETVYVQATNLAGAGPEGPPILLVTADSSDQILVALVEAPATRFRGTFIVTAGPTNDTTDRIHLDLYERAVLTCDVDRDGKVATTEIFCHGAIAPTGSYYRIQVNTQRDMLGTMMWDSGNIWTSTVLVHDERSPEFEYAGAKLDLTGKLYYWRIKLWNVSDPEGPWSIELAYFSGYPAGEEPRPPPPWITAQYREPKGTAEVGLVAWEETYTNLADVMVLSVSSNKNPLDNIETGQGTIYLSNIDRLFYSEYEASDFYKKLAGKKIRISLGAVVESEDDLYTKMTGIVKSINVNRLQKTAEIVALEFLDYYKTRKIKQTPVYKNITVFDLFCNLIRYCFPNWKNQYETAYWDYFVDPLGFRRAYTYLGTGDGSAEYLIQDHNKDPVEPIYNIIPETDAIYKNGLRLFTGEDYMIVQENRPLGVVSTLKFLKGYPDSDDILYGCFTIETIVEVIQYKDTSLIEELEKIAEIADCRVYANADGKLVCKSNRIRDAVDTVSHDTQLINLSSRRDTDEIINHVIVESKPYQIAGERTTLDSLEINFDSRPKGEAGIEHTFYFDEYSTELVFDLTWSLEVQKLAGTYMGSGDKEDFTLPLMEEVWVKGGLFGSNVKYGKIYIQVSEADSLHIVLKFWVDCIHPKDWYNTPYDFSATLTVKGITIGQPITYIGEAIDEASFHDMWIGEKRRTFTFEYLEPGIDIAQQAAESLLSIFHKLPTYYDCEVRGMPHLKLLDTVKVTEPTANLLETEMQVIKLVDNMRIGDYKTNLGLMVKEVPVIKAPSYWTPEWQEVEIYSEATDHGQLGWNFDSRIIGYSFRLEWKVEFNSPFFPKAPEHSGADYNIADLPYDVTIQGLTPAENLIDLGILQIRLSAAAESWVEIDYTFTLAENWTWDDYETFDARWRVDPRLTIKIACIPEFSYETVGPEDLPHYPPTNDYTPPEDQPGNGYYYDDESRWFMYYLSNSRTTISVRTALVARIGGEVQIPANADWTDHGIILSEGPSGSWDRRFSGMLSPCTVVKKGGTFFLYYIGADGNRSTDGGPRHRALGVATSPDGFHFTKRGRILTYLPHNNEEEGIFSAGAFLDTNGEIVMYWSALDAGSPTSTVVDSDIRLAVSNNGLNFTDKGDVISHADSKIWGYGDELFPVGAFREGNTYHVYYVAKGHGAWWDLGLGWGPGRGSVGNNTKKVLAPSPRIIGGCDPQYVSPSKIALFICTDDSGEIRTASVSSPASLSSSVGTYSLSGDHPDTVYLYEEP